MVQFAGNTTSAPVSIEKPFQAASALKDAGFGKFQAAKTTSKSTLPSFAAQLVGQPDILDEGLGQGKTAASGENIGKQAAENLSAAVADGQALLENVPLKDDTLSGHERQVKKESAKTPHKSTTDSHSNTSRKQKDPTSISALSLEYIFTAPVAIPVATEPLRAPGKKVVAFSPEATAIHVETSLAASSSHSAQSLSTKIQQVSAHLSDGVVQKTHPAEVHDTAAVDHSSAQISLKTLSEPQQYAHSEMAFPGTALEPAPVISTSVQSREIQELPEPKVGSKQKIAKDLAGAGAMQSHETSPGKDAVPDLQRTAGGIPTVPESLRVAENAISTSNRSNTSAQGNMFQQLDAGIASPTLLHSNAHSLAVGVHDPVLGWVEVQTQTAAGHLSATLTTTSTEAHASLAADGPAITQYLAEKNVSVHSVSVHTQSGSMSGGESQTNSGNGQQQATTSNNRLVFENSSHPVRDISVDLQEAPVVSGNVRISVRA